MLLIVVEVLFSTCKPDWIVNSSCFLWYLATTLQTNVSNLSPTLLNWNHWELKLPFSWSHASWSRTTWYKLQRNHHHSSYMDSLCTYCFVNHSDHHRYSIHKPGKFIKLPLLALIYLKILRVWCLEIFIGFLQNSETRRMIYFSH